MKRKNGWRDTGIRGIIWLDKFHGAFELRVTDFRNVPNWPQELDIPVRCNWSIHNHSKYIIGGASRWLWLAKLKVEMAYWRMWLMDAK